MSERKMVRRYKHLQPHKFEGPVTDVIKLLQYWADTNPGSTMYIDIDEGWDNDPDVTIVIEWETPETDEEMATRIKNEEDLAKKKLAEERAKYEALKAKFEGGNG